MPKRYQTTSIGCRLLRPRQDIVEDEAEKRLRSNEARVSATEIGSVGRATEIALSTWTGEAAQTSDRQQDATQCNPASPQRKFVLVSDLSNALSRHPRLSEGVSRVC
jgi:hypothetical protein